jgi:hypothetical protein
MPERKVAMSCAAPRILSGNGAAFVALPQRRLLSSGSVNNSGGSVREYSYQHSLDSWDWENPRRKWDQVVIRWWALVHDRLPWCEMPADDESASYMRAVVSERC